MLSPFIYLALAFVALAGLILNGIWEKKHLSELKAKNQDGTAQLAQEIGIFGPQKTKTEFEVTSQIPPGTFGKAEWEKNFPVTLKEVPPLPSNIHALLEQEDPCEPGKKLKDTCMLFLRPEKVIFHGKDGDKEITLGFDGVEELAKNAINEKLRTKYTTWDDLRTQMNQMPVEAGWVLMRKEVIPGSRNKSFPYQQKLLKGGFEVPKMMDAILLNILTFASEGKCLYGCSPWTYTRCQEKYEDCQAIVGGFAPSGLVISNYGIGVDSHGLSGVWKF